MHELETNEIIEKYLCLASRWQWSQRFDVIPNVCRIKRKNKK